MAEVVWHVTMSLDGFIAGPGGAMDWMLGFGDEDDEVNELIKNIGAVLAGRGTYDVGAKQERPEFRKPYGGAFKGPVFVLTHKPPHDPDVPSVDGHHHLEWVATDNLVHHSDHGLDLGPHRSHVFPRCFDSDH